jgi:hypothetical protein
MKREPVLQELTPNAHRRNSATRSRSMIVEASPNLASSSSCYCNVIDGGSATTVKSIRRRSNSSRRINNPAERALRCVAIGRKNYLFAGSSAGGHRAAAMYSLIETAKLNGLDPRLYLTDVLIRIADHPARHIAELLPWHWQPAGLNRAAA